MEMEEGLVTYAIHVSNLPKSTNSLTHSLTSLPLTQTPPVQHQLKGRPSHPRSKAEPKRKTCRLPARERARGGGREIAARSTVNDPCKFSGMYLLN